MSGTRARRLQMGLMRLADLGTRLAYWISGGWVGERQMSYSILLLRSVGRKTGKIRTHALLYLRDADDFVVCASNFGAPTNPAWYANLCAQSHASIQVGRERFDVVARKATAEERSRLWSAFLTVRPQYANYQAATTRQIPLVILSPIHPTQRGAHGH